MPPSMLPDSRVLMTGATGLIGGEILRRLEARDHTGRVWCLVRPTATRGVEQRLRERLERSGDPGVLRGEVRAVPGDIQEPDWGIAPDDLREITDSVDVIIHNAADTSFAPHRDHAATNVSSIQSLIGLARGCRRKPLIVYMSTAANVGRVTGACLGEEEGCRPDNDHFNGYTQSKAIAESILRASGLPVLILRPTVVLSAGLPDAVFARQILWCVPLTRLFRALPIDPQARVDVVDVGFVAEATVRLLERPRRAHDCYHLSAGRSGAARMGELATLVDRHYARRAPIRLIHSDDWTRAERRAFVQTTMQRRVFRSLRYYLPFLNMDVVYDDARLRGELPDGPAVRPLKDYLAELLPLIRATAALREAALP